MKNKINQNVERFSPKAKEGLSLEQVNARINQKLVNKTKAAYGKSYAEIIFTNVFSFFNILLFIIAGFLIAAKQYSSLLFLAVLIPNITIGLVEDIYARHLMTKLRLMTAPKAKVIRDAKEIEIDTKDVVLDEVVLISTSSQICADGVILEGNVGVNESLLTGESENIYKGVGDKVLSGSYVTSGKAYVQMTEIGQDSYVSKLQEQANKFKRSPSQILHSLRLLFRGIGTIVILMAVGLIVTYAVQGKFATEEQALESIGSIAGSMVSMIPSGLYLLTSVALAVGVIALARKRTSVQELYSIEMLARIDTLCVDKTGTITDGSMSVQKVIPIGRIGLASIGLDDLKQQVSNMLQATDDDNDTAKALKEYFNYKQTAQATMILPFSSENKYSGATLRGKGTIILGALDFLNLTNKKEISPKVNEYTSKGYRVLVVAHSSDPITGPKFLGKLKGIGIIVLKDNIKKDAYETFKWFRENDVAIRVISGDDPVTVSEVAKEAGIENADNYVSLAGLSLEDVKFLADKYTVFGRVTPEQKEVLVMTLKEQGRTVAMTGDGVNDILALKRADCSIAMASGSEAARNVSHIVLLDSNFDRLPKVVEQGRRVINNLQRTSSLFLTKTFFAMVLTLFFLILSWINPKYSYPFLTNHMYMWELLSIGISAFFLALQPNKERVKGHFLKNVFKNAIPSGICAVSIVLMCFGLYFLSKYHLIYVGLDMREVMVNGKLVDIGLEQVIGMSVIGFSIFSFISLFKVCLPFDIYRMSVFGVSALTFIGVMIGDYFMCINTVNEIDGPMNILKIPYQYINSTNLIVVLIMTAVVASIYLFVYYVVAVVKGEKMYVKDKQRS